MSKVRSGAQSGLLTGFIDIFFVLVGLTLLVGSLVAEWLDISAQWPGAWLLLATVAFWSGSRAARSIEAQTWKDVSLASLTAGLVHGLCLGLFAGGMAAVMAAGANVRQWLVQIYPETIALVTFDLAPVVGALVIVGLSTVVALAGGWLYLLSQRQEWRKTWRSWRTSAVDRVVSSRAVEQATSFKYFDQTKYVLVALLLLIAPLVLDRYWNFILGTVGIYIILGLGLNIVVGMAGLLNLGYAAFFAIGAYTVAILTAPQFTVNTSFWVALPVGIVLAVLTGVLLSLPVLRMRGDYLAIVTLGFGEIIRILSKSDILTDFTGGPRGIRAVAGPVIFGLKLNSVEHFVYFILLGIIAGIFVTRRLQRSRLGRALMAMREDETVAQAVGIYTLKYKVLAFAIGAAFAGLGGVIFASRNRFTGPEDFTLLVSINVLSLVIIGGMNSIPGVVVGALVLKGLPELLRQLDDYRMLAFGALLVIMMILRPEGLLPAQRGQPVSTVEEMEAES